MRPDPRCRRDRHRVRGLAALALCAAQFAQTAPARCPAAPQQAIAIDAAIAMPRDRAAGSVLHSAEYPLPEPSPGCIAPDAGPGAGWRYAQAPRPALAQDLYATSVEGIGVRLSISGQVLPTLEHAASNAGVGPTRARLRLEWIKTGEMGGAGSVAGTDLPTLAYADASGQSISASVAFAGTLSVRAATCDTADVRVVLAPIAANALPQAGASAGAKDFELRLDDCPAGMARLSYRLDPLGPLANAAASVLALDPASSARGLGLQIRDRQGRPIAFGAAHDVDAPHLRAGGSVRVPLQAAYYRTGAGSPAPGTVSASMTFTLNYE